MQIYCSWIGERDVYSVAEKSGHFKLSPIYLFSQQDVVKEIDEFHFLYSEGYFNLERRFFMDKLENELLEGKKIFFHEASEDEVPHAGDYDAIYRFTEKTLGKIWQKHQSKNVTWHFQITSGSYQMSAIWILLGKTRYPATFYQWYYDSNIKKDFIYPVEIPFQFGFQHLVETRETTKEILFPEFGSVESEEMRETLLKAKEIAPFTEESVLILGETGTGKELLARYIHKKSGVKDEKFYPINCAAIPKDLLESELFGYEKGAFSGANSTHAGIFENANNGTVFLDEIGDLPFELQGKLLRAIQEKKIRRVGNSKEISVNVRVLSATHKNIMDLVKKGVFREDLLYRLAGVVFKIPALRERLEDILEISKDFISRINKKYKNYPQWIPRYLTPEAESFLLSDSYKWPGNIRELEQTIKRASIFASSGKITKKALENELLGNYFKEDREHNINVVTEIPSQLQFLISPELQQPKKQEESEQPKRIRSKEELQLFYDTEEEKWIEAQRVAYSTVKKLKLSQTDAAEMFRLGTRQTFVNHAKKIGVDV
ncbi:sigma 54-interacting transcriptional regulator [bacterium]|nr:sigma 54-interacting transcriptional regulator [bacterium]